MALRLEGATQQEHVSQCNRRYSLEVAALQPKGATQWQGAGRCDHGDGLMAMAWTAHHDATTQRGDATPTRRSVQPRGEPESSSAAARRAMQQRPVARLVEARAESGTIFMGLVKGRASDWLGRSHNIGGAECGRVVINPIAHEVEEAAW